MTDEELDRINRAEEIQRYTENRCEALEKENAELEIDNKRLDFNEKVALVVKKEELKEQNIRLNKLCFDYQEREKRIAELEAENRRIANDLLDDWCRNKDDYCPHLKALEKENAELKDKLKNLAKKRMTTEKSFMCKGMSVKIKGHVYTIVCVDNETENDLQNFIKAHKL